MSLSFVSKPSNRPFLEQSILLIPSHHSCPRAQLRTKYLGLSTSEHSDNLAPYLKSERKNVGAAAVVKRMKKEDEILCQKHGEWSSFLILTTPHEAGIVYYYLHFRSAQSLSRVRLFATPWTAACQASLSITNSQSLLKPMSIELVMPSNHPILCRPFSTLHLSK